MRKVGKILLLAVLVATLSAALAACASQEEKDAAGKYELFSAAGIPGVTASTYEYSYIELKSNRTYHIENKVGSAVTQQDGKWSLKDGQVTFKQSSLNTSVTEVYTLSDDMLTIETTAPINGTTYNVTFKFKKAVE
ncbi:hypothetical protein FACS1894211_07310 [Clostridia bacterium]|nr:hypothetical protein FACS1894211_07310 [Clostridia bacterium]